MDSAKLSDWMQVLGIFAVVVSLIFVGLEMRQSQRIALSAAYQARADSSMNIRMAAVSPEAIQGAWGKISQGQDFEAMTPDERAAMYSLMSGNMVYLENMHYQYVNGFITEEHWQTNQAELEGY